MTTTTDAQAMRTLQEQYKPAQKGILSNAEQKLIHDILELDARNDIELQNIRDFTVLYYGHEADEASKANDTAKVLSVMDEISGICAAIDAEKFKRGLPV